MAAGDVFALSSYQENFALVVVDSLRLGVPVVLSNRVNIWSNIVDANAGLECRLEPNHIAEQLQTVLLSPEKCHIMAENGQQLVEREFIWRRCAERTKQAYESILESHKK
ncbi:MAG: glycosyltransferase [Planctomycetaceae bacterium]|nr:glycosyltransferase [bacterium]MDG2390425.1 glycosyltransferase [Planctomycetaceae bacterium]